MALTWTPDGSNMDTRRQMESGSPEDNLVKNCRKKLELGRNLGKKPNRWPKTSELERVYYSFMDNEAQRRWLQL